MVWLEKLQKYDIAFSKSKQQLQRRKQQLKQIQKFKPTKPKQTILNYGLSLTDILFYRKRALASKIKTKQKIQRQLRKEEQQLREAETYYREVYRPYLEKKAKEEQIRKSLREKLVWRAGPLAVHKQAWYKNLTQEEIDYLKKQGYIVKYDKKKKIYKARKPYEGGGLAVEYDLTKATGRAKYFARYGEKALGAIKLDKATLGAYLGGVKEGKYKLTPSHRKAIEKELEKKLNVDIKKLDIDVSKGIIKYEYEKPSTPSFSFFPFFSSPKPPFEPQQKQTNQYISSTFSSLITTQPTQTHIRDKEGFSFKSFFSNLLNYDTYIKQQKKYVELISKKAPFLIPPFAVKGVYGIYDLLGKGAKKIEERQEKLREHGYVGGFSSGLLNVIKYPLENPVQTTMFVGSLSVLSRVSPTLGKVARTGVEASFIYSGVKEYKEAKTSYEKGKAVGEIATPFIFRTGEYFISRTSNILRRERALRETYERIRREQGIRKAEEFRQLAHRAFRELPKTIKPTKEWSPAYVKEAYGKPQVQRIVLEWAKKWKPQIIGTTTIPPQTTLKKPPRGLSGDIDVTNVPRFFGWGSRSKASALDLYKRLEEAGLKPKLVKSIWGGKPKYHVTIGRGEFVNIATSGQKIYYQKIEPLIGYEPKWFKAFTKTKSGIRLSSIRDQMRLKLWLGFVERTRPKDIPDVYGIYRGTSKLVKKPSISFKIPSVKETRVYGYEKNIKLQIYKPKTGKFEPLTPKKAQNLGINVEKIYQSYADYYYYPPTKTRIPLIYPYLSKEKPKTPKTYEEYKPEIPKLKIGYYYPDIEKGIGLFSYSYYKGKEKGKGYGYKKRKKYKYPKPPYKPPYLPPYTPPPYKLPNGSDYGYGRYKGKEYGYGRGYGYEKGHGIIYPTPYDYKEKIIEEDIIPTKFKFSLNQAPYPKFPAGIQPLKYQPSLTAITFGIKGKPQKTMTGFELRPIPSNIKIPDFLNPFPVTSKRKKRRKKKK